MTTDTTTRPPVDVTIHGLCSSYAVEIALTLPIDKLAEACSRLQAAGITPALAPSSPPSAPAGPRKASNGRSTRLSPEYDADGEALCPVHHVELREGRFGLFCPARDEVNGNDKGYCNLKFDA